MGFFDALNNFADAVEKNRLNQTERNYEQMQRDQLNEEWKRQLGCHIDSLDNLEDWEIVLKYHDIRRRADDCYYGKPELKILDDVYAKRTGKNTYKKLLEEQLEYLNEVIDKINEKNRALESFKESIQSNEMVKEMIDKANDLKYKAQEIVIESDHFWVGDKSQINVIRIEYLDYGYPSLSKEQIKILGEYIYQNLKLKFIAKDCDSWYGIYLNDSPKSSW